MNRAISRSSRGDHLAIQRRMPTSADQRTARMRDVIPVVRWVLARGAQTVTCQINARANRRTVDVCVVPQGKVRGVIVAVGSPCDALMLHAHIASRLRDSGWRVISRAC